MKKIVTIIISILVILAILTTVAVVLTYVTDSQNDSVLSAKIAGIQIFDTNYRSQQQITINKEEMSNDYDSDGLSNQEELLIGTDIYTKDTDLDGLSDYVEKNTYSSDPLLSSSAKDNIKDGIKVYYGYTPKDTLPKDLLNKEETFTNEDLGISLTTSDIETKVFNKIYTYIPTDENIQYFKSFYLFNVNKAKIEIVKTVDMKDDIEVFYIDETHNTVNKIPFKISNDKISFDVSKSNLPIMIASKNTFSQLEKRDYIIIKSKSFLFKGFRIYEKSNSIFKDDDVVTINQENIDTNNLDLIVENVGFIKGFIVDRLASFLASSNKQVSAEKVNLSRKELLSYLSKNEETFTIGKDTFFINNFSTDINRTSHAAGLTFIPAYFKNKEIPLEQTYTFEEHRKSTSFDFGRDVEAYEKIFNKKFGEYTFTYSVPNKTTIDVIENPDKQVYKFIEMYNHFFFTNKDNFKLKKLKNYDETLMELIRTLNNNEYFVVGFTNNNQGHFLLGYDINSQENSSILEIKVYDPNIYSNKLNGNNINNTLYLTPKVETIVSKENTVEQYTKYDFIYNPLNDQKYLFSNKNYEIEFFNKF